MSVKIIGGGGGGGGVSDHGALTGLSDDDHSQYHNNARWDTRLGSSITSGALSARPAAGTAGRLYFATDLGVCYRDSGAAWVVHDFSLAPLFSYLEEEGHFDPAAFTVLRSYLGGDTPAAFDAQTLAHANCVLTLEEGGAHIDQEGANGNNYLFYDLGGARNKALLLMGFANNRNANAVGVMTTQPANGDDSEDGYLARMDYTQSGITMLRSDTGAPSVRTQIGAATGLLLSGISDYVTPYVLGVYYSDADDKVVGIYYQPGVAPCAKELTVSDFTTMRGVYAWCGGSIGEDTWIRNPIFAAYA